MCECTCACVCVCTREWYVHHGTCGDQSTAAGSLYYHPPLFFEAGSLLFLLLGTCEFPGDSSSLPSISCGDAGITPFSVDAGDLTQVITISDFTRRTISPARDMLFSTQISATLTLPQLGTYWGTKQNTLQRALLTLVLRGIRKQSAFLFSCFSHWQPLTHTWDSIQETGDYKSNLEKGRGHGLQGQPATEADWVTAPPLLQAKAVYYVCCDGVSLFHCSCFLLAPESA